MIDHSKYILKLDRRDFSHIINLREQLICIVLHYSSNSNHAKNTKFKLRARSRQCHVDLIIIIIIQQPWRLWAISYCARINASKFYYVFFQLIYQRMLNTHSCYSIQGPVVRGALRMLFAPSICPDGLWMKTLCAADAFNTVFGSNSNYDEKTK